MAIGSGLSGDIGFADEGSYGNGGVFTAPTRFLEVNSETFKKGKKHVQGGGLASGRYAELASRRVVTSVDASGPATMELANKQFGLLLKHILGSTPTVVQQGSTTAYKQTHALGANQGMGIAAQVGIPDLTGVVRPYSFLGGKITTCTFSCAVDGLLMVTPTFDFQNVVESQALAAPSYLTGLMPFHFGQLSVAVGAFGSEAVVTGVKSVSLQLQRPQKVDRYYAGAGAVAAPSANGALTQTAAGSQGARTEFVKSFWYVGNNTTLPAAETSLAVSANNVLNVAAPANPPAQVTGWGVAVSTTTGAETIQNTNPIPLGTAWVEPTTGLIAGAAVPQVNTATGPAVKAEPIMNNWVNATGSIDADFVDKTIWADRFRDDTQFSMIWTWTGPQIGNSGYAFQFSLAMPACFLNGDTPELKGTDVVSGAFPFEVQFDGTNPVITATYVSTDTAI